MLTVALVIGLTAMSAPSAVNEAQAACVIVGGTSLNVTNGDRDNLATLSWSKADCTTSYQIQRNSGSGWATISPSYSCGTSSCATGDTVSLSTNVRCTDFRVRGYNRDSGDYGSWSYDSGCRY